MNIALLTQYFRKEYTQTMSTQFTQLTHTQGVTVNINPDVLTGLVYSKKEKIEKLERELEVQKSDLQRLQKILEASKYLGENAEYINRLTNKLMESLD